MPIHKLPGFNPLSPYSSGGNSGTTQTKRTDDARLEYQKVNNPTYVYNRTDDYQNKITGKIQDILHGNKSISFKKLLKTNSDIAAIYNRLSDEGKKLVEFVISQDDKKGNVTERELRNLYRLMDMSGGNADMSFYDGDITDGTGRVMIEDLAKQMSVAQENLKIAHHNTKTTKELEAEKKQAQQRRSELENSGFKKEMHIDIQC